MHSIVSAHAVMKRNGRTAMGIRSSSLRSSAMAWFAPLLAVASLGCLFGPFAFLSCRFPQISWFLTSADFVVLCLFLCLLLVTFPLRWYANGCDILYGYACE